MEKRRKKGPPTRPEAEKVHSERPSYLKSKIVYPFLFLFASLLYINTYYNEYALDDVAVITGNKYTQQGFKGIPALLKQDLFDAYSHEAIDLKGGRYRPLTLISFAIDYQFFGLNPHAGHVINVLLYALIAVVLYRTLITMLRGNSSIALIATLLFIAHPVHTEAVANLKSRDELLSFLGLALVLLWLFKYVQTSKGRYIVFALIAYQLSLMSKENGITFIAVIPLCLFFFSSLSAKRIGYVTIPFLLVLIEFFIIRNSLMDASAGSFLSGGIFDNASSLSFSERSASVMEALGKYLVLLFYPHPLSSDYTYNEIPVVTWSSWQALVSLVVYITLFTYAIIEVFKRAKGRREEAAGNSFYIPAFSILLFMITLFPVSNILFSVGAPFGERFLFMPSLGFCLAIAMLIYKLTSNKALTRSSLLSMRSALVLIPILILYSAKTISRNPDWKNNFTLFSADVNNAPNSAKVHYEYANMLIGKASSSEGEQKEKDLSLAKSEALRCIQIDRNYYLAYYALGLISQDEGHSDSSVYYLKIVVHSKPDDAIAYTALGTTFGKLQSQFDSSIYYINQGVQLGDSTAGAYENLGLAYGMKNDFADALKNLEKALALSPGNPQLLNNVGVIYDLQGDKEKAQSYYARAKEVSASTKK